MTRARDIANLVDANGDIVAGALDNVPAADVVNDTTPQLGGDLQSNSNDVVFADNDKAIFGTGSDLQIHHNGSNSYIQDVGAGALIFSSNTYSFRNSSDTEQVMSASENGAVSLYHDNSIKLATTSTGVDVTGNVTVDAEGGSATADVRQGLTKWWITLEQGSSYTTHDSFNVSSTSDDGTGRATVSIGNNMNNNDYCVPMGQSDGTGFNDLRSLNRDTSQTYSTSQFGFYGIHSNGNADDYTRCFLASMGDLA